MRASTWRKRHGATPPEYCVVEFGFAPDLANAIRHRRDDDQPDMVGRAVPKNNWNTRTRARRYSASSIFAKAIVKSYLSQTQDIITTWRAMALTVAWQSRLGEPDTD